MPRPKWRTPLQLWRENRHKVIGFVDAATDAGFGRILLHEPPQGHWLRGCRDCRGVCVTVRPYRRHKVIGFVDAATAASWCSRQTRPCRHKVIGFVDAATLETN